MTTPDATLEHVRELIRKRLSKGDSLARIALAAGLSDNGLRRWDRETWNPTYATLKAVHALLSNGKSAPAETAS